MATFTVSNAGSAGDKKWVNGTFTTTAGDTSVSLTATTHGFNHIVDYKLTLNTGAIGVQEPKVSISSGTITATYDDTRGYSGRFYVMGS